MRSLDPHDEKSPPSQEVKCPVGHKWDSELIDKPVSQDMSRYAPEDAGVKKPPERRFFHNISVMAETKESLMMLYETHCDTK